MERIFPLVLIPPLQVCLHCFCIIKYSLNPSIAVPLVLCDSRALYRSDLNTSISTSSWFSGERHTWVPKLLWWLSTGNGECLASMPVSDCSSGDGGHDSGMPKLHFSSKDGRITIAWGNHFEALGKYSLGLFLGSKECSACILKSLCPDSGEGGAGIPKVPFLPAGSGEPMCEPEPSTGGSIVPIAGCWPLVLRPKDL